MLVQAACTGFQPHTGVYDKRFVYSACDYGPKVSVEQRPP